MRNTLTEEIKDLLISLYNSQVVYRSQGIPPRSQDDIKEQRYKINSLIWDSKFNLISEIWSGSINRCCYFLDKADNQIVWVVLFDPDGLLWDVDKAKKV